jgi:hypothetical protein
MTGMRMQLAYDIAELNSRLTSILGFDFFKALRSVEDRWEIEVKKAPKKPIIQSLDTVLSDISDCLRKS